MSDDHHQLTSKNSNTCAIHAALELFQERSAYGISTQSNSARSTTSKYVYCITPQFLLKLFLARRARHPRE